jgi:2-polyprenyl-6-methoxyphenol hydroxylase-like FAD-dependent oxidoreductase
VSHEFPIGKDVPRQLPQVLIIGSGVAGPVFAFFLKKADISSGLNEAYIFVHGVGGGLGFAPNGINVLRRGDWLIP